mmetsp:Transcript_21319/g.67380  ORF Transcript_21319/g.67380 Transcript_21319/m.67380 type:complete len:336 (+) Transcript_21319:676-1683(+)
MWECRRSASGGAAAPRVPRRPSLLRRAAPLPLRRMLRHRPSRSSPTPRSCCRRIASNGLRRPSARAASHRAWRLWAQAARLGAPEDLPRGRRSVAALAACAPNTNSATAPPGRPPSAMAKAVGPTTRGRCRHRLPLSRRARRPPSHERRQRSRPSTWTSCAPWTPPSKPAAATAPASLSRPSRRSSSSERSPSSWLASSLATSAPTSTSSSGSWSATRQTPLTAGGARLLGVPTAAPALLGAFVSSPTSPPTPSSSRMPAAACPGTSSSLAWARSPPRAIDCSKPPPSPAPPRLASSASASTPPSSCRARCVWSVRPTATTSTSGSPKRAAAPSP